MPNIVIVGRSSLGICDEISTIVTALGVSATDGVITFSQDTVCIDMSSSHHDSPYLIVRDIDGERADKIALALNAGLDIDVEVEILRNFYPRKGTS